MKKFLLVFFILLIVISSTWILYIRIDPKVDELLNVIRKDLKFRNILFVSLLVPKIEQKYNLIITKISYIPWGIYVRYDEAKTFLYVEFNKKNYYYNQKFAIMKKYAPFDGTIKIEGTNDIGLIQDILRNFGFFRIHRIKFYDKYFEIYGEDCILKISLEDYQEKKRYIMDIVKNFNLKGKTLDFRFRIPFIGGT
ncbi:MULTISPECIES: hypothetical protein [Dictyoglomus]|uniref:Cell division protein FtsQ n=1 Tax=Dictyoglomus turgidum (strain DSM 6724 / Z-1310) TaxID=515635 RepID=B8E322_DICTD|nr:MULTISPECIES: hypothetical protein [Dictyoglomus]ACK42522.1 conserved hypothetical protein [Dictyoglomus turgidum DSM 6724]HBU32273.1 hypothetical protein [Dictyoglomus sp.]